MILASNHLNGCCTSIAASGRKNLSGWSQSDPAVGARLQQLLVGLAAPNHKRNLSFRGLLTAIDPLRLEEHCIINGSLAVFKLSVTKTMRRPAIEPLLARTSRRG